MVLAINRMINSIVKSSKIIIRIYNPLKTKNNFFINVFK